ncbi:VOC family protein [Phycicoccus flavus]|uniref:VOC family protein n=1 Tax=Phycicoccus flavus TaxID=2502783 RepID=A0A8T6R5S4_9MICO|nr:VOC family protein [Phycicoccus flavus]NHA69102.1 VOC family protein [Phycicoccus flavus]
MDVVRLLSNHRVSDLDRAERWYGALVGRAADARPMEGLLEWHLSEGSGIQVWLEPEAAGSSGCTVTVRDLDDVAERLTAAGVEHDGVEQASSSRLLRLTDPDGNRVVLVD